MTQEIGHVPRDTELAGRLGVPADEVHAARQAEQAFTAFSLDAPVARDREDSAELGDMIGVADTEVDRALDMEAVTRHWGELADREQRILVLRFYGNLSQAEIGSRLGISQMHVSRLLARAFARLRERLTAPPSSC